MGSISTVPNGISFLTQPGTGLLSDLPMQLSASTLQAASPQDLVDLSSSALQIQEVDGLFGITPPSQTTAPAPVVTPPAAAGTSQSSSAVSSSSPSGVSPADLAGATPAQQASIAQAANQQQMLQDLYYPPVSVPAITNITG